MQLLMVLLSLVSCSDYSVGTNEGTSPVDTGVYTETSSPAETGEKGAPNIVVAPTILDFGVTDV